MAVNAYLIIDGVDGPSTSKPKAIDILGFSFGASQVSTIGVGASGGETRSGRASIQDVSVSKVMDKTSPLLFDHCVTGNILKKVTIVYDKPLGDKQEEYYKVEMENALLTGISHSGSSENPMESLSFGFEKLKLYYNPEDGNGKLKGWVGKGFNLTTLKPY